MNKNVICIQNNLHSKIFPFWTKLMLIQARHSSSSVTDAFILVALLETGAGSILMIHVFNVV